MDQRLKNDSTSSSSFENGKAFRELVMIEVEHYGRRHTVRALYENEAKAMIAKEYGFEYNSIRIENVCWYEATDMNYFRFSVCDWHYEVRDYGAPVPVDAGSRIQRFMPVEDCGPHIISIVVEGGCVREVFTTLRAGTAVEIDLLDFDNARADGEDPDAYDNMREKLELVEHKQRKIF